MSDLDVEKNSENSHIFVCMTWLPINTLEATIHGSAVIDYELGCGRLLRAAAAHSVVDGGAAEPERESATRAQKEPRTERVLH